MSAQQGRKFRVSSLNVFYAISIFFISLAFTSMLTYMVMGRYTSALPTAIISGIVAAISFVWFCFEDTP